MTPSLKIIKNELKRLIEKFNWKVEVIPNNQSYTKFSNLISIRQTINEIQELNIFEYFVMTLKTSAIFTSSANEMSIQQGEANVIISNLNSLKTLSENFLNTLTKTLPEEDPDSINIKLPQVNDFDELSNASKQFHIALTQVIFNKEINGETKIVSVENGSIWFNVFVGLSAVTVIASLAWSAAVIYKKIQEGRLLEQQVRSLKVKNESLDDILVAQKAETQLMIEAEADHINSEYFKENAAENIERIKNSITILADLIGKGAEIHPALQAPENVSNLFPDVKNLLGLESKIKRIANG